MGKSKHASKRNDQSIIKNKQFVINGKTRRRRHKNEPHSNFEFKGQRIGPKSAYKLRVDIPKNESGIENYLTEGVDLSFENEKGRVTGILVLEPNHADPLGPAVLKFKFEHVKSQVSTRTQDQNDVEMEDDSELSKTVEDVATEDDSDAMPEIDFTNRCTECGDEMPMDRGSQLCGSGRCWGTGSNYRLFK